MKIDIFKVFTYVLLFYLIYNPTTSNLFIFDKYVIIPIITIAMSLYYIMKFKKNNRDLKISKIKLIFCILIIISNLYYLVVYCLNNISLNIVNSRIIQNNLPICYIIIISILLDLFKEKGYSKRDIFNIVVNLAVFQGIVSLLMVVIPDLHKIALNLYYRGKEENVFISNARIYGISSDYTYATPIYHGFIASLVFYSYLITNNRKNIIKCFIIIISTILNGRTGLIIFIILFIYYIIVFCLKKGKIIKLLKGIIIAFITMYVTIILLKSYVPSTYQFIYSLIKDTNYLISEEQYNGNYKLLRNSLYFPKGYKFVIGEGYRVYGDEAKERGFVPSDIGYVNDIYMGGLIFGVLLYGSYVFLIKNSFKNNKIIELPLYITLLIANFKGEAFRSSIIIFLIIFICLLEVYNEKFFNNNCNSCL